MEVLSIHSKEAWDLPEAEIISLILEGQKDFFEILMRRNNQTLYRAIRGYLQDENDINDTMQEAYIKAFQKLSQFRQEAKFSTWLVRIGINEALLRIRKQKKRNTFSFDCLRTPETLSDDLKGQDPMTPEKIAMQQEAKKQLEKAIDQLPDKYRSVYILREVEGMDNRSIAQCLNLSESNVKVRFHRAKEYLKKELLHLSEDDKKAVFSFGNAHCDALVKNVMNRIRHI